MMMEASAFAGSFDWKGLEAGLRKDLRGTRLQALALLLGGSLGAALTVALRLWPVPSQPHAWTLGLALTGGFFGGLVWNLWKQTRLTPMVRAAQGAAGGYRELPRSRVRLDARENRAAGWLSIIVAVAVPAVTVIFSTWQEHRARQAFPGAEVTVNYRGALVNEAVVGVFLIASGIYMLRRARRLEKSIEENA